MITENYRVLTPAYNRDYKNRKSVEDDFFAGKDFKLQPEDVYCSVRDFAAGTQVNIRYAKLTKVTVVTVK